MKRKLLILFSGAVLAAESQTLTNIYAPVVVGTPTVDAFNGLFQCPDGEIRHYGTRDVLSSEDDGLTWKLRDLGAPNASGKVTGGGCAVGMNPKTGTCLRPVGQKEGQFVYRSTNGIDGPYTVQKVDNQSLIMLRPPYFLQKRSRVLFAGHLSQERPFRIVVFRSDDDGVSWRKTVLPPGPAFIITPPHQGPRWENWCVEPTLLELKDGRIWMLARTSQDNLYECFSKDGGETWSAWQPSRFYATLTMPTLFRLSDGRILLFWCNTTPLPERVTSAITGNAREDAFNNRDACHVAISEDDGWTWIGFRELRLNPLRNAGDLDKRAKADFSVQQPQALELPNGKVLVAVGQGKVRALVIFDVKWLYETRRSSTFENGLEDWSTHKYINKRVGHCAYNRVPGAQLVADPDKPNAKVLQLRHPLDPALVFDKDGAVWNFPAAVKGSFRTRIKLPHGSGGAQICLVDRWFNPTDPVVQRYAMYVLAIPGNGRLSDNVVLSPDQWHDLRFDWDDSVSSACKVTLDGIPTTISLSLNRPSINGISYIHFQSLPAEQDPQGFLIELVEGGRDPGSGHL
jgi:BNR repeat-like domain